MIGPVALHIADMVDISDALANLSVAEESPEAVQKLIEQCLEIVTAGSCSEYAYGKESGWQAWLQEKVGNGDGSWGGMLSELKAARSGFVRQTLGAKPRLPPTMPWGDEVWTRPNVVEVVFSNAANGVAELTANVQTALTPGLSSPLKGLSA